MGKPEYKRGEALRVQLEGHRESVSMVSIERPGMCAGGGLLLVIDRNDGEVDRLICLLNNAENVREALRMAADEPNIDRARAIADEILKD